jgi:hypothetical protein
MARRTAAESLTSARKLSAASRIMIWSSVSAKFMTGLSVHGHGALIIRWH